MIPSDMEYGNYPSVPMYRVPTVNLSNSMFMPGAFFNPAVFYGTPVYKQPQNVAPYPRYSGNGILPTPPQLPSLPDFSSPYFTQNNQQQQQQHHGYMIEGVPTTSKRSLEGVKTRGELIDLIFLNGIDAIPVTDPPLLFNKALATKTGLVGTEHVAQICCQTNPNYETYLCKICEYWNTPGNMIEHLGTEKHQLNHMRKKYKEQSRKVQVARKRNRQELLDKIVSWISKVEIPKIVKRAKTVLTLDILLKVWPKFNDEFDDSWKNEIDDKKPEIKTEIFDTEIQNTENKVKNEEPEIITIDEDDDTPEPEAVIPPVSSLSIPETEEIGTVLSHEVKNSCVHALIFIRAEALDRQKIDKKKVEKICNHLGVTMEMVFSDEILDYAGKQIGNVEILVAIAEHFANPVLLLTTLFKKVGTPSLPALVPPHPSKILMDLGLNKAKAAKLIRDVDMIMKSDVETIVDPSTVFTRRPAKKPYVHHFDRGMISYDGDYIETCDMNESRASKQRKF